MKGEVGVIVAACGAGEVVRVIGWVVGLPEEVVKSSASTTWVVGLPSGVV
jgi:hypothetical protein